jgi:hypothetical protein
MKATGNYIVKLPRVHKNRTLFALAKKHIVKGKRGGDSDLSRRIDEIVYGE